jgi:GT2 family glycosyltransferase
MTCVSVLVINFNGRHLLSEVLQSLERQTRPADEVILVDNASTDGSAEFVRDRFPWVKVIASPTNTGFSGGNNIAVAAARGEYLALLNSDAVADPRWLAELVPVLDADPRVGATVPKIYRGKSARIEQVGAMFNNLGNIWGRGFNVVDRGQYDAITEVPALTACAAVVRRQALEGDTLFDSTFFMYHEELDLSLRLRGRGYSIVFVPTAIVHHKGMQAMKQSSPRPDVSQQFYCNRNRMKILAKYYPPRELVRSLPLIVLSLVYWNSWFLRQGGIRFFLDAVASQVRFARAGLAEREQARGISANLWLSWMRRQGLREILSVKAAHDEVRKGEGLDRD